MPQDPDAHFNADAFAVSGFEHAQHVTVGDLDFADGEVQTCDARWEADTQYTLDFIGQRFGLEQNSLVLDYGCGTGRIAKGLIERVGCQVVGVDASPSMRVVARAYAASDRFQVMSKEGLDLFTGQVDLAICLWVLQHVWVPADEIAVIKRALRPRGYLLVFNEVRRHVPTLEFGFAHDGVNMEAELAAIFGPPIVVGRLDEQRLHPKFCARTFWAIYQA